MILNYNVFLCLAIEYIFNNFLSFTKAILLGTTCIIFLITLVGLTNWVYLIEFKLTFLLIVIIVIMFLVSLFGKNLFLYDKVRNCFLFVDLSTSIQLEIVWDCFGFHLIALFIVICFFNLILC